MSHGLDGLGLIMRQCKTSLFTTQNLGPINPPIQWVMRILFPGVKQQCSVGHHSPESGADIKKGWTGPTMPCLQGVVRK